MILIYINECEKIARHSADACSSLQITFHADRPASSHTMPPGGCRLAVINAWGASPQGTGCGIACGTSPVSQNHEPNPGRLRRDLQRARALSFAVIFRPRRSEGAYPF